MKKLSLIAMLFASTVAIAATTEAQAGGFIVLPPAPCEKIVNYSIGTNGMFPVVITNSQFYHNGVLLWSGNAEYSLGEEEVDDIQPYVQAIVREIAANLRSSYNLVPGNNPDFPGACFFEAPEVIDGVLCNSIRVSGNIVSFRDRCTTAPSLQTR